LERAFAQILAIQDSYIPMCMHVVEFGKALNSASMLRVAFNTLARQTLLPDKPCAEKLLACEIRVALGDVNSKK